jgi:hypothetical protein
MSLVLVALSFGSLLAAQPLQAAPSPSTRATIGYHQTRPPIESVRPREHSDLPLPEWQVLRQSHLEAVAQMIELYPNEPLYFLARDSELLFDAARYLLRDEPRQLARLHLVNISRRNMGHPDLVHYLAQEGISTRSLAAGTRPVLIDTGFSGTISEEVGNLFPPSLRSQIRTHLMCSSNPTHPSSRTFLLPLNPAAALLAPGQLHGTIVDYEMMPRMTPRSYGFNRLRGRWDAISGPPVPTNSQDGVVNPELGQRFRKDLLMSLSREDSRRLFRERRALWRTLRSTLLEASNLPSARARLLEFLQSPATASLSQPTREAMLRDLLDWLRTNAPMERIPDGVTGLSVAQFGLAPESTEGMSNKKQVAQKIPQWAAFLNDPATQIPLLVQQRRWTTLGSLLDTVRDAEVYRITAATLAGSPASPRATAWVRAAIDQNNASLLEALLTHLLPSEHWRSQSELFAQAIRQPNALISGQISEAVARIVAADPSYGTRHPEVVRALIQHGGTRALALLADAFPRQRAWAESSFLGELLRSPRLEAHHVRQIANEMKALTEVWIRSRPEYLRQMVEHSRTHGAMHSLTAFLLDHPSPEHTQYLAQIYRHSSPQQRRDLIRSQSQALDSPEPFLSALIQAQDPEAMAEWFDLNRKNWRYNRELTLRLIQALEPSQRIRAVDVLQAAPLQADQQVVRQLLAGVTDPDLRAPLLQKIVDTVLGSETWPNTERTLLRLLSEEPTVAGMLATHPRALVDQSRRPSRIRFPELFTQVIARADTHGSLNQMFVPAALAHETNPRAELWRSMLQLRTPAERMQLLRSSAGATSCDLQSIVERLR